MANLSLKHMYKVYDGKVKAVNDFTMDIDDKEFIVFVGPSGCGKSTTLRMIAGLEEITAGELRIGDDVVNDMEPKDRNIAMVFQNYALYPHMSVYDNMAFSLKIARMPKDQIHDKVLEAARILGITEYLDRKPKALSGGQRQRVALGRAIVRNPKVFLLDEPLSNLDAKLRAQMRTEITRLHEKLQTTFIYVTHDQVEAMTMGTRIVVMDAGYVKQIDTPQNLYRYPANKFVAGFIGTPQMNFFDGVIEKRGAEVFFRPDCGAEIRTDYSRADKILVKYMDGKHRVIFGIRPDDIRVYDPSMSPDDWEIKEVVVGVVENLGGETLVYANFDVGDIDNEKGSDSDLVLKTNSEFTGRRGDIIKVGIHKDSVHVFDKDTEVSIKTRIPSENVLDCVVRDGVLSFAGTEVRLPEAVSRAGSEGGELIIPTDALSLGAGDVKLKITGAEEIGGITLYEASLGDVTVFIREEGSPRFSPGEETEAAVDFKKISIGDEVRPLETENRTDGSFLKRKERNERGKKAYNFYLEIGGQSVPAEDDLSARLFSYKKTKIFETPLEFVFRDGTASLTEAPSDLSGVITDVHDYGSERFVTVKIGSESICVRSDSGEPGAAVNVKIDQSRLGVKDKNLDIQMI